MRRPDLAILGGGEEGWHGARLRRALERLGVEVARVPFAACGFALQRGGPGVRLGALDAPPRVVLVRFIPAGSFEQVTLRLSLLHALEHAGCRVVNAARAIERCVDKGMTSYHLASAGLPTPATWVVETREAAAAIVAAETAAGTALVLKPLFGAQGKGLRLLRHPDELPPPEEVAGVYYLQRFVGPAPDSSGWHDYRVLVVGGEPVAAMARHGETWITNIHQGAVPRAVAPVGALAELAVAAAGAVGTDYAGVDLIADEEGRLHVLEVNSMPAWQGLQRVSEFDLAGCIAARLARLLESGAAA